MHQVFKRALLSLGWVAFGLNAAPTAEQVEFFEKKIRPVLAEHCYECHSVNAKRLEGKLRLDSRSSHLKGGDTGPAIVPGDADSSLLVDAIRYESLEMPPRGKLKKQEVDALVRWVNLGAPWPKEPEPTAETQREEFNLKTECKLRDIQWLLAFWSILTQQYSLFLLSF